MVNKLDQVDYYVYSIITNPFLTQQYELPDRASLFKVPLWGTEEPSEHLPIPFSLVYLKKKRTTSAIIEELFIPLFKNLIQEILSPDKNPQMFGETLVGLYRYFQEYEYKESFKSELAWDTFKKIVLEYAHQNIIVQPDIFGLIQSLGWVYRFLTITNTPVPNVDVSHSAASAFCGIPCVIAKIEHNTPFLLTEHGVYLREQYLSLSKRNLSPYLNTFLIRLIHSVSAMNFHFADQVSPVCHFNTRWETRFGVPHEKIDVIYNGVDKDVFVQAHQVERVHPTVVTVARIDPIKDIISLIKSADIVRSHIPNVKFIVYGAVSVKEYYDECLQVRKELGLEETFIFAGHSTDMASAYHLGDVVALTSISEAFPYSVVEAMMTGKPVVATDVGGIREAIGDTGHLVTPRQPKEIAQALTILLNDPELCVTLGKKARERALSYFTLEKVLDHHIKSYMKLAQLGKESILTAEHATQLKQVSMQKLYCEKAYALLSNGFYQEAISQFRLAINVDHNSPSVPVYLSEIIKAYHLLGEHKKANEELVRLKALFALYNFEYNEKTSINL